MAKKSTSLIAARKRLPKLELLEPRILFDGSAGVLIDPLAETNSQTKLNADEVVNKESSLSSPDVQPVDVRFDESSNIMDSPEKLFNVISVIQIESNVQDSIEHAADQAGQLIRDFFSQTYSSEIAVLYSAEEYAKIQDYLSNHSLNIQVEIRDVSEMGAYLAAFADAQNGHGPRILINADWVRYGLGEDMLVKAILEEYGHAIDAVMNPGLDAMGDEGQLFASLLSGDFLSEDELSVIRAEQDSGQIWVDGELTDVEFATLTFKKVYQGTETSYGINTSSISWTTPINAAAYSFISANPSDVSFSGNNVSGQLVYYSQGNLFRINGVISGPFKSGGTDQGFYFAETTVLGGSTATGRAYLLIIPGQESAFSDNSSRSRSSDPVGAKLTDLTADQSTNQAPVITSNGGGAIAYITVNENQTSVTTVTSTDANGDTRTYSLYSGADASLFSITAGGVLTFKSAPSFEAPLDLNRDNIYEVAVMVADVNGATDVQTIYVTVSDLNDNLPIIQSNGGGSSASINVSQGDSYVTRVQAADADANEVINYLIDGGADAALFSIDSATGVLSFKVAPAFNVGGDNSYEVIVVAKDTANQTDTQTLTVNVTQTDTVAPAVVITASDSLLSSEEVTTIYFTFSESVNNFTLSDVVSVGGALTNLVRDPSNPLIYSATFTQSGSNLSPTVTVQPSSYQDDSGNLGAGNSLSLTTDLTAPTLIVDISGTDIAFGETRIVTFTFSEDPGTSFSLSDVTVTNGTLFNLRQTADPKVWTASLQATSALAGPTVSVGNNTYTDLAGNLGSSGSDSATLAPPSIDLANTATSDTGSSSTDNITSNRKPIIVGQAPLSDSTVKVEVTAAGVTYTYNSVAVSSGNWSLNLNTATPSSGTIPLAGLPEGFVTIKVTGNTSLATATSSFLIDITPPATPTVTSTTFSVSTPVITGGVNLSDSDSFSVAINGVTYSLGDGYLTYNATAKTWALAIPATNSLPAGTYSVVATVTDIVGLQTSDSSNNEVTISFGGLAAPILDLNPIDSGTRDNTATYTIGGDAVSFAGLGTSIADSDSTSLAYLVITTNITNLSTGDRLELGSTLIDLYRTNLSGTVFYNNTYFRYQVIDQSDQRVIKFTSRNTLNTSDAVAVLASYEALIDSIKYSNGANNLSDGDQKLFALLVNDQSQDSQVTTFTVTADLPDLPPVITGPSGGAGATSSAIAVNENQTAVTTFSANEDVTWTIAGGADQDKFDLVNGVLSFKTAPNYESPTDDGTNNTYVVEVQATDGAGNTSTQTLTVTINNLDEVAPVITGPSGGAGATSSAIAVNENQTAVTTFSANEDVTWTIAGGADQDKFDLVNGVLSFKTAPNYESPTDDGTNNTYVVEVQATDGAGNTSTQTLTVTINNLDEVAPVITGPSGGAGATSSAIAVNENQTAVTTFSANEDVTWTIAGGADQDKFDLVNGVLSFKTAPNYESPTDDGTNNTYVVEVQATDGAGNTSTQTLTVTINNLDEVAPVITGPSGGAGATSSAIAVNENQTAVTTFSANEDVTWTIAGGADQDKFDLVNGVLSFKTAPNYESPTDDGTNNTYVVEVQATDGAGNTSTQTLTVTINNLDEVAPVITGPSGGAGATSSAIAVNENQTAVTTFSANEDVTWTIAGGADQDKFDLVNGVLSFKTAPNYESPTDDGTNNTYVVEVQATDGAGNTSTQTLTVTINNLDEVAPVITGPSGGAGATSSAIAVNENQTAVTTFSANEDVTWTIAGGADQDKFDLVNGVLSFKTAPNYESPTDDGTNNTYVVEVQATDGAGNTSTQTLTVTINNLDEVAPVITGPSGGAGATSSAIAVNENQTAVTTFSANEDVTWTIAGGADQDKFDLVNGVLSFKTAPNYESPTDDGTNNTYVVEVQATDGAGNTSTQTLTVTINNLDEVAPVITGPSGGAGATSSAIAVNENQTAVTTFSANEDVTWTIAGGADQDKFDLVNGVLSFKTAPNYESPTDDGTNNTYVVEVQATDGAGNTSTQTLTVTINNLDEVAPVITGPSGGAGATSSAIAVNENQTAVTTFSANEDVTWTIAGGADQDKFDLVNGVLSFKTAPNYESPTDDGTNNTYVVEVQATDGAGNTSTQTLTVTINNLDEVAPVITGPSGGAGATSSAIAVNENQTAVTTFSANEDVTWTIAGGADQDKFDLVNGVLSFKTAPNYESPTDDGTNNTYVVEVQATDGAGNTSTQTLTVTVLDVDENLPPVSRNSYFSTLENQQLTAQLAAAVDPDGHVNFRYSLDVTTPQIPGLVLLDTGGFIYTPTVSGPQEITFNYRITDELGAYSVYEAKIFVQPLTLPVAPVIEDVTENNPNDPTPDDLLTDDLSQVLTVSGQAGAQAVRIYRTDNGQLVDMVPTSFTENTSSVTQSIYIADFSSNNLPSGRYFVRLVYSGELESFDSSNQFTIDSHPQMYDDWIRTSDGQGGYLGQLVAMDENDVDLTPLQPWYNDGNPNNERSIWYDSDGQQVTFDIVGSQMVDDESVERVLETGGRLILNHETGRYTYQPADGFNGIDVFKLKIIDASGNASYLLLSFDSHDPLDRDGIPAETESALSRLISGSGDSNGDGYDDASQNSVSTLAWIKKEIFDSAVSSPQSFNNSSAVVTVVAQDNLTNSNQADRFTQITNVHVTSYDDDAQTTAPAYIPEAQGRTDWDPLVFSAEPLESTGLNDVDPNRAGTQLRFTIDISRANIPANGVFNAYLKWIDQIAIDAYVAQGLELRDLDGRLITEAGWYDFTRRAANEDGVAFIYGVDAQGNPIIAAIDIILTDNAFGDSDARVGFILDPGVPVLNLNRYQPSPGELNASRLPPSSTPGDGTRDDSLDGFPLLVEEEEEEDESLENDDAYATKELFTKASLANTALKGPIPLNVANPLAPENSDVNAQSNQNSATQNRDIGLKNATVPPGIVSADGRVNYQLPSGTFVGGQGSIVLTATLKDGSSLPTGLKFDSATGRITGDVPVRGATLEIRIEATDSQGNKAETQLKIMTAPASSLPSSFMGKPSLTDQMARYTDVITEVH